VHEISTRSILFDEEHTIVADMSREKLLKDIELLKKVNIVDKYYHFHGDSNHIYYHDHN
jgi:cobalt/nickel transport system ATP-binding protein